MVTDYLERALPLRRWAGVRWHLAQCDACRRYVRQMQQTIRLLADTVVPATPDTEDSILRALHGTDPAAGD